MSLKRIALYVFGVIFLIGLIGCSSKNPKEIWADEQVKSATEAIVLKEYDKAESIALELAHDAGVPERYHGRAWLIYGTVKAQIRELDSAKEALQKVIDMPGSLSSDKTTAGNLLRMVESLR